MITDQELGVFTVRGRLLPPRPLLASPRAILRCAHCPGAPAAVIRPHAASSTPHALARRPMHPDSHRTFLGRVRALSSAARAEHPGHRLRATGGRVPRVRGAAMSTSFTGGGLKLKGAVGVKKKGKKKDKAADKAVPAAEGNAATAPDIAAAAAAHAPPDVVPGTIAAPHRFGAGRRVEVCARIAYVLRRPLRPFPPAGRRRRSGTTNTWRGGRGRCSPRRPRAATATEWRSTTTSCPRCPSTTTFRRSGRAKGGSRVRTVKLPIDWTTQRITTPQQARAPHPHLYELVHVHRHLVNLRAVVLLDVAQNADVVIAHEVDRHAVAPVAA